MKFDIIDVTAVMRPNQNLGMAAPQPGRLHAKSRFFDLQMQGAQAPQKYIQRLMDRQSHGQTHAG